MYNHSLHSAINALLQKHSVAAAGEDNAFYSRLIANAADMDALYRQVYGNHANGAQVFTEVIEIIIKSYKQRPLPLREKDQQKQQEDYWFLSNRLAGMSLYVDRFCGKLANMPGKLDYLKKLGVNVLHVMPVFESPAGESDGGYAVSDYRKVDSRFGTMDDLMALQQKMQAANMHLMLDIVLNHTSHRHAWAVKAKQGDVTYQDYYYMYSDRAIPSQFEEKMPEIFPENAPGNFTWSPECGKWVMTVFHDYQWDLNYTNPRVFAEMLDTIFFYANLGVDILRIDAPAFIWKQLGTTCQNLPMVHTILQLIRQCVQAAAPGMAILGEAIVAPKEVMKYFGTGFATARECDFAYNATHMALQWDMLATGDTRVMLEGQDDILQKPYGTSWISYTRCHDDIGLGYEDAAIKQAGFEPYEHRRFLKNYYSGEGGSPAMGALFSVNPKTQDARISGSLASLCGLERALNDKNEQAVAQSIQKILLMQAHSFFMGGLPMLFYGDEAGYTNDYSYLADPGKSYDNRWMHRPVINWEKNTNIEVPGTVEQRVFSGTQRLLGIRSEHEELRDCKNLEWINTYNVHVAAFVRRLNGKKFFGVFNFSPHTQGIAWHVLNEVGSAGAILHEHWLGIPYNKGHDHEYMLVDAYAFCLFTAW